MTAPAPAPTRPYEHRYRAEIRRRLADTLVKVADHQEQAGHVASLTRDRAADHYRIRDEELRDSDTAPRPDRPTSRAEYLHRADLRLNLAVAYEQLADYQEATGSHEDAAGNRACAAYERAERTEEIAAAAELWNARPPPR